MLTSQVLKCSDKNSQVEKVNNTEHFCLALVSLEINIWHRLRTYQEVRNPELRWLLHATQSHIYWFSMSLQIILISMLLMLWLMLWSHTMVDTLLYLMMSISSSQSAMRFGMLRIRTSLNSMEISRNIARLSFLSSSEIGKKRFLYYFLNCYSYLLYFLVQKSCLFAFKHNTIMMGYY